jgi:hypothetical protein
MKYTVLWVPAAEAALANIWLNADDRREISRAAHELEAALQRAPENEGESREEGRRVVLETPLGVKLRVFPQDRIVRILDVWHFDTRK